jgi:hypothetical protein
MPAKKYKVTLTNDEKKILRDTINKGKQNAQNARVRKLCCSERHL